MCCSTTASYFIAGLPVLHSLKTITLGAQKSKKECFPPDQQLKYIGPEMLL